MKFVRTFLLLPLSILACALFSPATFPTPTAIPPATPTAPPLPSETPTEAPTNPPPVTLSPQDFTPILYRDDLFPANEFQIIGGVQGGAWLVPGVITNSIQPEQSFDTYAPTGFAGVAVNQEPGAPRTDPRCGDVFISTDFNTNAQNLIGVAQGWDVTHRPGREIAVDTPVYYNAVAEWLTEQGFTLPFVQINRIVLVDLEGDGVDEVLISAAYFKDESGHMAEQGDYSIILMRKLVGGEVVAVPVVADLYTSPAPELVFPFTYSLGILLDLNQDGTLELVVDVSRWEGDGVILYEVDGTNVTQALRAVCTE